MKRLLISVAMILCSLLTFAQFTGTQTDAQGVEYTANDDGTTCGVSGLSDNYSSTIIIPEVYEGLTVTSIGGMTFIDCDRLTSITIPSSVTTIGEDAFSSCSLTSIIVEEGNSHYDSRNGCNAIIETTTNTLIIGCKTTIIPNSVTRIGNKAFKGCVGLTSIIIPSSVTKIGGDEVEHDTFFGCYGLTSITVEEGNTHYDSRDGCNAIIETSSKTLIAGCKTTVIPNSVTSIGVSAFKGCVCLSSITIPNSVTTIGEGAFEYSGLTSITIPNSVTTIGEHAFYGCHFLTSVTIPNSVTSIGGWAFSHCSGLTSVIIPNSVTDLHSRSFRFCSSLTSVTILKETPIDTEILFDNKENVTVYVPSGCKETYEANSNWTGFKEIKEIFLGSQTDEQGVTYTAIDGEPSCYVSGHSSDYNATIVIPEVYDGLNVTGIGEHAFTNCSNLTSVTIPNSVASIGNEAFKGCTSLNLVVTKNPTPLTVDGNCFDNCSNATLNVPVGSKTAYEAAEYWNDFNEIEEILIGTQIDPQGVAYTANEDGRTCYVSRFRESFGRDLLLGRFMNAEIAIPEMYEGSIMVTSIGINAFGVCQGLTSITIPNSVTNIGNYAFAGCTGLTSISIPNSVMSIGEYAFNTCSGLTSITIPNSVTNIGKSAFGNCPNLTSITIPNSVTSIGVYAFQYCSGLTSIIVEGGNNFYDSRNNCNAIIESSSKTLIAGCKNTIIPNSVTSIGEYAFSGCDGLTSIVIPNSVTNIGEYAFSGCDGLTSIVIPNSVTSIGDVAFGGCSGLTSIVIPNSVTSIGKSAFWGCGLTSVSIPNSVTSIGDRTFQSCSGLIEVIVGAATPIAIDDLCFTNRANATLYVPIGCKAAYQAAQYWQDFKEIIEISDVSQMDNAIYLDYPEAYIGGTVPLYVKMKNTMTPNGCSFMLTLPAGMSLAKDAGGDVIYTLADRANKMNVTILDHNDGTYDLALMPATSTATITGNENTIVKLMLQIPDNISTGDYIMHLTKSLIQSETNNNTMDYPQSDMVTLLTVNDYRMGDVNGDDGITPSDAIMTLYYYFNVAQTGFNAKAADVTGDGKVTPADAIEMLYKFFGIDRSDNSRRRAQQVMEQELDPQ